MPQPTAKQRRERRELVLSIGHCQNPECPGEFPQQLSVHEITRGVHREAALSERLACMVLCGHCNGELFTDYAIWPLERQAALQCLLCADIAEPGEILAKLNSLRGRAPGAISWQDVAPYLALLPA
jgi:hypothetical protein